MGNVDSFARKSLLISMMFALGCGASPASPDAGRTGSDSGGGGGSLVGTWQLVGCVGTGEFTDCITEYTFGAAGEYSIRSSMVKDAASTTGYAGCTINLDVRGFRYAATATTLSVTAETPIMYESRTGCSDPADDAITPFVSTTFTPSSFTATDVPYTVSGNTLTLGGTALTRL